MQYLISFSLAFSMEIQKLMLIAFTQSSKIGVFKDKLGLLVQNYCLFDAFYCVFKDIRLTNTPTSFGNLIYIAKS